MPKLVCGSLFTAYGIRKTVNSQLSIVNWRLRRLGFSLIELLVVIGLFSLTAGIVIAAYSNFNQTQVLQNAALALKNDIRFTQNKALSGDKSTTVNCGSGSTLIGWYLWATKAANVYTIFSDCKTVSEAGVNFKVINLPVNTTINDIFYNNVSIVGSDAIILFQPIDNKVTFHTPSVPPFFNASGNLLNQINSPADKDLTIELIANTKKFQLIIKPSGEVHEKKVP